MKKLSWALYDDPRRREAASGRHGTKIASLPLFTRLQKYRCIALSDVMGHVWTAPSWQGESSRRRLGRCSHVFGL
jgi:hypothetical protein